MPFEKIIIAVLLVLMLWSLGSAFWYMLKDRGKGTRTVRALTARIAIWVILLLTIIAGIHFGWITPSNTIPLPQ
ncbi:MAG: DUF2909 domain-containing protein [Acidiferrobacterales bacterium]|nr:DUF2909 domain-containing protein [Acidiferrobacterales bacterium]